MQGQGDVLALAAAVKRLTRMSVASVEPNNEQIRGAMRSAYDELIHFAATDAFQRLLDELFALPECDRPGFVNKVILNNAALAARGIAVPEGILIQRSAFGDRRPTLFCIKKYLPTQLQTHWQNVNITFDNEFDDSVVPRDRRAWRPPLPVEVQQAVVAGQIDEEIIARAFYEQ